MELLGELEIKKSYGSSVLDLYNNCKWINPYFEGEDNLKYYFASYDKGIIFATRKTNPNPMPLRRDNEFRYRREDIDALSKKIRKIVFKSRDLDVKHISNINHLKGSIQKHIEEIKKLNEKEYPEKISIINLYYISDGGSVETYETDITKLKFTRSSENDFEKKIKPNDILYSWIGGKNIEKLKNKNHPSFKPGKNSSFSMQIVKTYGPINASNYCIQKFIDGL